jgi:hypothetical protein
MKSKQSKPSKKSLPTIGWREWLVLPDLGIAQIKAKIDTGACSSAIHAFDVEILAKTDLEQPMVRFKIHPYQRNTQITITTIVPLLGQRKVRSSSGHAESRPVIETTVELQGHQWPIELTLTNRDVMGFRMLLGRQALRHRFLINPGRSFLQSSAQPPSPKLNPTPTQGDLSV